MSFAAGTVSNCGHARGSGTFCTWPEDLLGCHRLPLCVGTVRRSAQRPPHPVEAQVSAPKHSHYGFFLATGSVFCFVSQSEGLWFLSSSPIVLCWFHRTVRCNPVERNRVWGPQEFSAR